MKNILTIDLEEWFHANYDEGIFDNSRKYEVRVLKNTYKLLDHLSKHHAKATFFTLGYVAEKHPNLIRDIQQRGHEIASHGLNHQLVYKQSIGEFKDDVSKSIAILEEIIREKIIGYRAPSWSISEQSTWAWSVLEELELKYDASVFPIKTFMYGIPSAPRFEYHPNMGGKILNLMEIPTSTLQLCNRNIPFSGGFYFRALPYSFISYGIQNLNRQNRPVIIYLHPREIDTEQPKLKLSMRDSLIHYTGINRCERKLVKLLKQYEFVTIKDYYGF